MAAPFLTPKCRAHLQSAVGVGDMRWGGEVRGLGIETTIGLEVHKTKKRLSSS